MVHLQKEQHKLKGLFNTAYAYNEKKLGPSVVFEVRLGLLK